MGFGRGIAEEMGWPYLAPRGSKGRGAQTGRWASAAGLPTQAGLRPEYLSAPSRARPPPAGKPKLCNLNTNTDCARGSRETPSPRAPPFSVWNRRPERAQQPPAHHTSHPYRPPPQLLAGSASVAHSGRHARAFLDTQPDGLLPLLEPATPPKLVPLRQRAPPARPLLHRSHRTVLHRRRRGCPHCMLRLLRLHQGCRRLRCRRPL